MTDGHQVIDLTLSDLTDYVVKDHDNEQMIEWQYATHDEYMPPFFGLNQHDVKYISEIVDDYMNTNFPINHKGKKAKSEVSGN